MADNFALLNALKFLGGMLGSKSKACAQAKLSLNSSETDHDLAAL